MFGIVHVQRIGNKPFCGNHFFNHLMSALFHVQLAVCADFRAAVIVLFCNMGKIEQAVKPGNEQGCGMDAGMFFSHSLPDFIEDFIFKCNSAIFRIQNLAFKILQFIGDITLCIYQSLFADIIRGNFFRMRSGNFKVITENLVVSDFYRGNTGSSSFLRFQARQPAFAIFADLHQFIQFGIVTGFDDSAFRDRGRRIFTDGFFYQISQLMQRSQFFCPRVQRTFKGRNSLCDFRKCEKGFFQSSHISRTGVSHENSGSQPFQIINRSEKFPNFPADSCIFKCFLHSIQTDLNFFDIAQRIAQPVPQPPAPH